MSNKYSLDDISIHCSHCTRYTLLSLAYNPEGRKSTGHCVWRAPQGHFWWIGICNNCKSPTLVLNKGVKFYPNQIPKPSDTRIPESIRENLDEAKVCLASSANRAAAVLSRRTLQVTCLEKGAPQGMNLSQQINWLFEQAIITAEIKKWADAVRWVGNDAAHSDSRVVSKDEANEIIELAESILEILYVAPAKASKYLK